MFGLEQHIQTKKCAAYPIQCPISIVLLPWWWKALCPATYPACPMGLLEVSFFISLKNTNSKVTLPPLLLKVLLCAGYWILVGFIACPLMCSCLISNSRMVAAFCWLSPASKMSSVYTSLVWYLEEEKGGQDLSVLGYDPELEIFHVLETEQWTYTDGIASWKRLLPAVPLGGCREKSIHKISSCLPGTRKSANQHRWGGHV